MMCVEGRVPEDIGACVIAGPWQPDDCRSACRSAIPETLEKGTIAGNTAAGAALYLLSEETRRECRDYPYGALPELSGMNGFETCFTEHMFFS